VLQESLTNVHRHSGSSTAHVRVTRENGQVIFEVKDQGRGIAVLQPDMPVWPGIGLRGMSERLRELGGSLEIASTGQGTVVRAVVPCTERAQAASTA